MIEVDTSRYTDKNGFKDLKKSSDIPSWKNQVDSAYKTIDQKNQFLSLEKVNSILAQPVGKKRVQLELFCGNTPARSIGHRTAEER